MSQLTSRYQRLVKKRFRNFCRSKILSKRRDEFLTVSECDKQSIDMRVSYFIQKLPSAFQQIVQCKEQCARCPVLLLQIHILFSALIHLLLLWIQFRSSLCLFGKQILERNSQVSLYFTDPLGWNLSTSLLINHVTWINILGHSNSNLMRHRNVETYVYVIIQILASPILSRVTTCDEFVISIVFPFEDHRQI